MNGVRRTNMADISFSRILAFWADRKPDAPAVTCGEHTATWAELEAGSNRLARAYAELGVGEADNVTIALPNSIEFVEATYAVWKLGATPQPVSSRLPAIERDAIIEIAESSLVVGVQGADAAYRSLPPGFEPSAELSDTQLPERTSKYMKAMTSGGSTGRPKLIVARQAAAIEPLNGYLIIDPEKSVLVPGPLYHNGPFMMLWAPGLRQARDRRQECRLVRPQGHSPHRDGGQELPEREHEQRRLPHDPGRQLILLQLLAGGCCR